MKISKMKMCCLLEEVHRAYYVKFSGATVVYFRRDSTIFLTPWAGQFLLPSRPRLLVLGLGDLLPKAGSPGG